MRNMAQPRRPIGGMPTGPTTPVRLGEWASVDDVERVAQSPIESGPGYPVEAAHRLWIEIGLCDRYDVVAADHCLLGEAVARSDFDL